MVNVKRSFYFFVGMALVLSLIPWMAAAADGRVTLTPEELKQAIIDLQFKSSKQESKTLIHLDGLIFKECAGAARNLDVPWTHAKEILSPSVLDDSSKSFYSCQKKFRDKNLTCANQPCVALSKIGGDQFQVLMQGTEGTSTQVALTSRDLNRLDSALKISFAINPLLIEWGAPEFKKSSQDQSLAEKKPEDPRQKKIQELAARAKNASLSAAGFKIAKESSEELVKINAISPAAAWGGLDRFLRYAISHHQETCNLPAPDFLELLKVAKDFYRPARASSRRAQAEQEERNLLSESDLADAGRDFASKCVVGDQPNSKSLKQTAKFYRSLLQVCSSRCEDRGELITESKAVEIQSGFAKLDEIVASGKSTNSLTYVNAAGNLYKQLSGEFRQCSNPTAAAWGNGTCNMIAGSMNELTKLDLQLTQESQAIAHQRQLEQQQRQMEAQQARQQRLTAGRSGGPLLPGLNQNRGMGNYPQSAMMRDRQLMNTQNLRGAYTGSPLSNRNMNLDPRISAANDPYHILLPGLGEYSLSLNRIAGESHLPGFPGRFTGALASTDATSGARSNALSSSLESAEPMSGRAAPDSLENLFGIPDSGRAM